LDYFGRTNRRDFHRCHDRYGGGVLVGGEVISGFFKPDANFG
jgi:hypothetical protein